MHHLTRARLLDELRALRPGLERRGVTHVALFGSRARQDHRADSDVDLAIEVDEQRKFSLLDLVGVGHEVQDRIGVPANVFLRRSMDQDFLNELRSDGIVVF